MADEEANQPVKGFISVQRDTKSVGDLQCDEAMHHAAQHTHGVDGLIPLQAIGHQDAQHNFNNLLLRSPQFVIARLCCPNSSGIKAGVFSGKGAIGVCQGEDGLNLPATPPPAAQSPYESSQEIVRRR